MQIFCFLYKTNGYILYFCTVFFIVLDLRLSRLGLRREPFFYAFIREFTAIFKHSTEFTP